MYKTTGFQLSPTAWAAGIQAEKTVNVTVQFSDKKTTHERELRTQITGGGFSTSMVNAVLSSSSTYSGKPIGEGRFLLEVPEQLGNAQLLLKQGTNIGPFMIDNELSYRCMIAGKEIAPLTYPQHFPLGKLDGDKEIEIICYKSPKMTLHVVDESGEPVMEYFAGALYTKRGQTATFEQNAETMTMLSSRRQVSSMRSWAHASMERCITLDMDVEFTWRDFGKDAAKVNYEGILPDEELRLYVIGRGYEVVEQTIPKMAEGEERELTVTLKKTAVKELEEEIGVPIFAIGEDDTLIFSDGQWSNEKTGKVIPNGSVMLGKPGLFRLDQEGEYAIAILLPEEKTFVRAKYIRITEGGNAFTAR